MNKGVSYLSLSPEHLDACLSQVFSLDGEYFPLFLEVKEWMEKSPIYAQMDIDSRVYWCDSRINRLLYIDKVIDDTN